MKVLNTLTLALSLGGPAAAVGNARTRCTDACGKLAAVFPRDVAYPDSTAYEKSTIYWSNQQSEMTPACFVSPRNARAVAKVVRILTKLRQPFNVKGGGHGAHAGDSNISGGVTIDLARLDDITVSKDRKTVSLGPGLRWGNVSDVLDPMKLAVVGGRASDVGIAGFILGGGISYFSGRKGWAADNVRNFEVVLSSGRIVNASPKRNRDLYWALRGGGGSNYGIVTRFDLVSFDQGDIWSNVLSFPGSANETFLSLFRDFTIDGQPGDPAAHSFLGLGYDPSLRDYVVTSNLYHSDVPPEGTVPKVFAPFQSAAGATSNVTLVADVSTHTRNMVIPYGFRNTWYNTLISANSLDFLKEIVSIYEARNAQILQAAGDRPVTFYLTLQAVSTNILAHMQKYGGNPLNLYPDDGPMMLVSLPCTWSDPELDSVIESSTRNAIETIIQTAKERELGRGHVYMNYYGKSQKVLQSYGRENLGKLRRIAKKYDRRGSFEKLWPGYCKLY